MGSDEVLPGLFAGDASAAMQPEVAAFDLIVNVTREVPFSKLLRDDQETVRYDILDDDSSDQASMVNILLKAHPVIDRALRQGKKVLVHCLEGKQRSCTVVAFCVVRVRGLSPAAACAFVRDRHRPAWDHGCYVHYVEALGLAAATKGRSATFRRVKCDQTEMR